jgi:serine/threonine protein kinase
VIGALVGHFRVEEKLGQGGMGVVYRARDEKLHRMVALKLLPAEWATEPTARARLLREARAAASLSHRNVATVYEVGEEADHVFIALELIEGRSLRAFLQVSPPSLNEALRIATEIVRGVAKAHEKGIIHRDLKPENVMLTEEGEVKVLDFGLARQLHQVDAGGPTKPEIATVTRTGDVMGTPAYMSPEQATARPLDARSDVFSLGLILYELTAGRHPFAGNSALEIAAAIVRDDPAPASSVNAQITPALDRIIATCLAKAPRERYSTARDLLRDLERLTHEGSSAPMISPGALPASRRSRTLVAGLAAGLVAIVVVALWFQRPSRDVRASRRPAAATFAAPPPRSSNPEAVRVYLEGLQADHDGRRKEAKQAYFRALELDPKLAPALLRVALRGLETNDSAPSDKIREYFRGALTYRASLDERDQAWLDAWEPVMQREPSDQAETIRRLRAALQRFPKDPEIAADLVGMICSSPDIPPGTRVAEAKAAGLWPDSLASVIDCTNEDLGKKEEGPSGQDPCERTPADLHCLGVAPGPSPTKAGAPNRKP